MTPKENDSEKPVTLGPNTRLSIGHYAILLAGSVYLVVNFESIKHRLDTIEQRLPETWTLKDQLLFESQLQGKNPSLAVPDSSKH